MVWREFGITNKMVKKTLVFFFFLLFVFQIGLKTSQEKKKNHSETGIATKMTELRNFNRTS